MRQGRKPVAVNALVIFQVLGRNAQYVVVFSRHQVADENVGTEFYRSFEFRQRLGELARQRDMDDDHHLVVERGVGKARVITADRAVFFQNIEPPRTGGRRQADNLRQFRIGNPSAILQYPHHRTIYGIKAVHRGFFRK